MTPTPADRLAFALCAWNADSPDRCKRPCDDCILNSEAVAHELAALLRERYGHSTTADWLDAIGSHQPES